MTKTFSRRDTAKFYNIFPSNMSLSLCLFLLSRVIFLQVKIYFLSLPFSYSECVGFFHGHYPSLTYRSVWVLLELYIILISYFKPIIWTRRAECMLGYARCALIILDWKLRQWQTWCTLALFYNTSITFFCMFQGLTAHHQEANCIDAASGFVLSVSDRSVHRSREKSLSTWALNGHWLRGRYQMLHQCN
jgi:hypothetical protein